MNRRILTITPNDQGIDGGPAIHFLELWNCISRQQPHWTVKGIAPSWTGRPPIIDTEFELQTVRVPPIRVLRAALFDMVAALHVLFRKYDLVYVRMSQVHIALAMALRIRRVVAFIELNGIPDADNLSATRARVIRHIARISEHQMFAICAGAICVSESIQRHCADKGVSKSCVVANGVAPRYFEIRRKPRTKRPVVIYVGTFTPWDGAGDVVQLAHHFPDVDFVMVGGSERANNGRVSAPPNITFVGSVSYRSLPEWYRRADAGIVLYEKKRHARVQVSSLKTLEYVASGLPTFSTSVPGQEFLAEKGIGVLTPEAFGTRTQEDFRLFISSLGRLSDAVDRFRVEFRGQASWERAADQTCLFISHVTDVSSSAAVE